MIKRIMIGLACLVAVLAVGAGIYFTYQRQDKQALQTVLEKEKQVANQSFEIKSTNQIGQSYYLSPGGKATTIYGELMTWNQASLNQKRLRSNQLAIVRPESQKTALKGVRKLLIHQVIYEKNGFSYQKKSDRILRDYHIKDDENAFTLGDLLNNYTNRFSEEVANLYPNQTYTEPDVVADFEKTGRATDGFDYRSGKIYLTGNMEIPLKNLFDVVNSDYLQDDDLKAYQDYQEQKVAEEQARREEEERQAEEARKAEEAKVAAQQQTQNQTATPSTPISEKVVALTFDDGPNPATTPQILSILVRYSAKATFFVLGSKVAGNEGLLQNMVAAGNEIGNHSWNHPNLTTLSAEQITWQVSSTNQAIANATGIIPKILRPPYGATNATVQSVAGLHQVLWNVDTLDWQSHNTQAILANVQAQTRSRAIILMHDIHQSTVDALPTVLDYLIGQGYQFVTVSELCGY